MPTLHTRNIDLPYDQQRVSTAAGVNLPPLVGALEARILASQSDVFRN